MGAKETEDAKDKGETESTENTENNTADSSRIAQLRKILHLSRDQFAASIGFSSLEVLHVERTGKISAWMSEKISNIYGVRKEWLYGDDGEPWSAGRSPLDRSGAGQRLEEVYKESKLLKREFCDRIHANSTFFPGIMNGEREVTLHLAQMVEQEFDVSAGWLLYGDELSKDYPCGDKMIVYLKTHPDARKIVWDMMQSENGQDEGDQNECDQDDQEECDQIDQVIQNCIDEEDT